MSRCTRAARGGWLALCLLGALAAVHAQDDDDAAARISAPSPQVQRGQTLFRSSCGFCHGADAGGAQGPALTTSPLFTAPDDGHALAAFLKSGRPALGMPPFENLAAPEVAAIRSFVQSRRAAGPAVPPMNPDSILVGDAAAGRAFFEGSGHCAGCHSAAGDLRGIGARYDAVTLQGRIVNPRVVGVEREGAAERAAGRITVTVNLPDGRTLTGTLVQINDFFVTLIDRQGVRRTLARDNDVPSVTIHDPAEAHRQMMLRWTDQQLWNVTAYLASLK